MRVHFEIYKDQNTPVTLCVNVQPNIKKVRVYYKKKTYLLKCPFIMGVFSVFVNEKIQSLGNDSAA